MKFKDKRTKLTSEVLSGIKVSVTTNRIGNVTLAVIFGTIILVFYL